MITLSQILKELAEEYTLPAERFFLIWSRIQAALQLHGNTPLLLTSEKRNQPDAGIPEKTDD